MTRILIVYGSTEGHTAKIASCMALAIRKDGHLVELHEAKELRHQVVTQHFDGVMVGGSVHAGDYQSSLREFVKLNRAVLESVPSAFFSVSLAAADSDDESMEECRTELDKFTGETG